MTHQVIIPQSDSEQFDVNLLLALQMVPTQSGHDPKRSIAAHAVLAASAAHTAEMTLVRYIQRRSSVAASNPNSTFDRGVNQVLQDGQDAYQARQNQGGSYSAGGVNWPVDPNFPPSNFDPNQVPNTVQGILDEMRLWLHDLYSYKRNPNMIGGFILFMINVTKALPSMSADAQAQIKAEFANMNNISQPGESLADMMAQFLRDAFFFGKDGGEANCRAQMAALAALLNGSGVLQNNPFLQALADKVNFYSLPSQLNEFFHENEDAGGNPIYTPDQFWIWQQGQLAQFLVGNSSYVTAMHQMLMDEIGYMIKHIKNGYLLIQLIMSTMGENMNEQQQSLGGYGSLSKSLAELAKMQADLNSKVSAGTFNGDDAKAFIEELRKLGFTTDSQSSVFGPVLPSSVDNLYKDICAIKLNPADPKSQSIGDIINSGQDVTKAQWDQIGTALQTALAPTAQPSGGTTPSPTFNQVTGDLKSIDTAITGQTQTISTAQGAITSKINTLQSSMKDIMVTQWSENWNHTLVQNQQRAGS